MPQAPAKLVESRWIRTRPVDDLEKKSPRVFRHGGRQIALFRSNGRILACDNRCPHEGYPLSRGHLSDECILTCNWHNWKFNLRDGANLFGGDRLRTYPVEVRDGEIWVDVADPPRAERRRQVTASLKEAFDDHEYDRIAREIARLLKLETDPLDVPRLAIRWSFEHMEFGWTHAYAGMADWLNLYHRADRDRERRLVCLLEPVAHAAFDVLREEAYPYPEAVAEYHRQTFLDAIEDEDEGRAIALVRGGLRTGMDFHAFEGALSTAALAHYSDFGHSLIYVTKARELCDALGGEVLEPLLLSLVRQMVYATREERIPEFRKYQSMLDHWGRDGGGAPDHRRWRNLGINQALDAVARCADAPPETIYRELLIANAVNMLHYDADRQDETRTPVSHNVNWLDFTHGLTFANAVRRQCTRYPQLWPRGLLQMACFLGRNAAFTGDMESWRSWTSGSADDDIADATRRVIDHGQGEHIVSVHMLKTTLAVAEEAARLDGDEALYLTAALNRFLGSPLKRRHTRRTAYQSLKFVSRE